MNKIENVIRLIMLIVVTTLNIIYIKDNYLINYAHILYLFLLLIIIILSIKDLIKKNLINKSHTYNIVCILVYLIISFILIRAMYDSHIICNDTKLINEYLRINNLIYNRSNTGAFLEIRGFYLQQNFIYFNIMLILLLVFRKINLKNKKKMNVSYFSVILKRGYIRCI